MEIHRIKQDDDAPLAASIEAEQFVLGLLLLQPEYAGALVRSGGSGLFCDPLHAHIADTIIARNRDNLLVSPISIGQALATSEALRELGGQAYLVRLAAAALSSHALPDYLAMLKDLRRKRDLIAAINATQAAIVRGEQGADHIAAQLEAALIASEPVGNTGPVSMLGAVTKAMGQIKAAYEGDQGETIRTGIARVDNILGAMYPGDLVYLGGRPSMGKTALALSIALNAARAGHGVAIASLEMTPEAMAMRALSEQTSHQGRAVEYASMRRGEMSDLHVKSLQDAARTVADLPVTFLPREYNDIGALTSGVKQIARGGKLKLLVVDYLQLMRTGIRGNTNEQVSDISKNLKALAMQLGIPVLALSQLSRAVESRDDKRPRLSDLRDSGSIEQDADTVMFCYRDQYYLEREEPDISKHDAYDAWQAAMERTRNRLEIIIAKQRAGAVGTAHVRCNPALNLVWED